MLFHSLIGSKQETNQPSTQPHQGHWQTVWDSWALMIGVKAQGTAARSPKEQIVEEVPVSVLHLPPPPPSHPTPPSVLPVEGLVIRRSGGCGGLHKGTLIPFIQGPKVA